MTLEPHSHQSQQNDLELDQALTESGLLPKKKELHKQFIQTLQSILPHLGKDESKIISALIILALKLEGIIGKELSKEDSKLIEILKEMIIHNDEKKESAILIAKRLMNNQSE